MNDFEDDLRRQLTREAGMVQGVPRHLAARIATASGGRSVLWLRLAPVAVALVFVAALGLVLRGQLGAGGGRGAAAVVSSPSPAAVARGSSPRPTASAAIDSSNTFTCGAGAAGGHQVVQPSADGSGNLIAVRVAHQAGFDRAVFEFAGATLPPFTITLQAGTHFTMDPSGMTVNVKGGGGMKVVFHGASERDVNGRTTYTGSNDIVLAPASGAVNAIAELRQVGDSERVLSWAVGISHPACSRVLQLSSPTRLVIDLRQQP